MQLEPTYATNASTRTESGRNILKTVHDIQRDGFNARHSVWSLKNQA